MRLYCADTSSIHIVENLIFHERIKHNEVNCHLVCQKIISDKIIELQHVLSINQLVLTIPLGGLRIHSICDKLGMYVVA